MCATVEESNLHPKHLSRAVRSGGGIKCLHTVSLVRKTSAFLSATVSAFNNANPTLETTAVSQSLSHLSRKQQLVLQIGRPRIPRSRG